MSTLAALRSSMPSVTNMSRSPGRSGSGCTRYSCPGTVPNGGSAARSSALDPAVAQPQRRRVAGVDDRRGPGAQSMRASCPVTKPPPAREVAEARAGQARLLGEPGAGPPRVAQRADQHGREHGGVDGVAHGVRDREVQRVALDAKSNVSPPTLPAGSSQAASVNCPASHV